VGRKISATREIKLMDEPNHGTLAPLERVFLKNVRRKIQTMEPLRILLLGIDIDIEIRLTDEPNHGTLASLGRVFLQNVRWRIQTIEPLRILLLGIDIDIDKALFIEKNRTSTSK
jgi:ABC-type proline/glycine betaine transport system ATPase subunit